eukprot:13145928-Alexandrium_andersonii.AAC.1
MDARAFLHRLPDTCLCALGTHACAACVVCAFRAVGSSTPMPNHISHINWPTTWMRLNLCVRATHVNNYKIDRMAARGPT